MEIQYDFSLIWQSPIQKLDQKQLAKYEPKRYWAVEKVIDKMGALSAQAQRLKRVVTSYEKILDSEEDQAVYILWEPGSTSGSSLIIGLLKIGRKHLYLLDQNQQQYEENPLCLLDFYVDSSRQRKGYGNALLDFMLVTEVLQPYELAYDKPSAALLGLLAKRYQLDSKVPQTTGFVVFEAFFDNKLPVEQDVYNRSRSVNPSRADSGTSTPRRPCSANVNRRVSAAALIHGDVAPEIRPDPGPETPMGRKNTRDFGHTRIW
ncbi:unnamed protein product, partial [Mesorhabditis belari]|uniref:Alpha-tubulin N-acetyltransferase n=1 Tax=Mesorhabditis belari TaxID=2138241 RepID=A0AAF3FKW0_9BILA